MIYLYVYNNKNSETLCFRFIFHSVREKEYERFRRKHKAILDSCVDTKAYFL